MSKATDTLRNLPVAMIVDDDPSVRFMVSTVLEDAGMGVVEADSGDRALRLFEETHPDIVLLDVMMPGMDGFEACAALRELPGGAHTPILMVTGLDDVGSINLAYEVGATDFVTKPINYVLLTHRVRYVYRAAEMANQLRKSEARLNNAQRIAKMGDWEWAAGARAADSSSGVSQILGLEPSPLTYRQFLRLVHPEDRNPVKAAIHGSLRARRHLSLEHRVLLRDGAERIVSHEAEITPDPHGNLARIVGTIQDVTERRAAEETIRHLSYYDSLTGLPNRTLIKEHLVRVLAQAGRYQRAAAILFLDLDNFQRINDTLGYRAGDKLLQNVARRLNACVRGSDCLARPVPEQWTDTLPTAPGNAVARLGGDEFVVLLAEVVSPDNAAGVARRLENELSQPSVIDGTELHVTASIGISAYPLDGETPDVLLTHAESAARHAKALGRNRYQFYAEHMNRRAVKRFSIETQLRKALENDELEVHYQPKLNVQRNEVVGVEALVRWPNSERGVISPSEFIPVAEETGLILPLGEWVLHEACAQARSWEIMGQSGLVVSVNLSAVQFREKQLGPRIASVLQETGLNPSCLELELTEGVLLDDTETSIATLKGLGDLGLSISVDDFGTGYSSLGYLKRLPIDTLKIDQSFVREVREHSRDGAIVTAIIALAKELGLNVIAEGVERQDQLDFLLAHGCNEIQGYLVQRALPADAFTAWWRPGGRLPEGAECIPIGGIKRRLRIRTNPPLTCKA